MKPFKLKQVSILFLLLVLELQSIVTPVFLYAQTPSTPPEEALTESLDLSTAVVASTSSSNEPGLSLSKKTAESSALVSQEPAIQKLAKKDYKADEEVSVRVINVDIPQLTAEVFSSDGEKVDVEVRESINDDVVTFSLLPPAHLNPGKYHLSVRDKASGKSYEQDFTWGVLAINMPQSVYKPEETIPFAIAVLDEQGQMVCDAKVSLAIFHNGAQVQELSTEKGSIHINPECQLHDFTLEPDYEAQMIAGKEGDYALTLTATTKNGTYSIKDGFRVKTDSAFTIERKTATRLFPPKTYPVTLEVTATEDFTGVITDIVPENFVIDKQEGTEAFTDLKTVTSPDARQDVLGIATTNLGMPFADYHPESLSFGEQLKDPQLIRFYAQYGLSGHDGIDFDMPEGTPIFSVDDGIVLLAGDGDYGTTIVIDHEWGRSYYGHLSKTNVVIGDKVKKGDIIAFSGNTGLSTGAHLHFGLKPKNPHRDNGYFGKVDPSAYLGLKSTGPVSYGVKVLKWDVSMKKGETVKLGYTFKAPNISPQFYTLGPVKLFDKQKTLVYEEGRQWQLAVDAVVTIDSTVTTTKTEVNSAGSTTVFTTDQIGYTFYVDSGGYCTYAKTTDGGTTWTSDVSIVDSNTTCMHITVWYDRWTPGDTTGTYIHIVTNDTTNDDVYYNRLDTANSDTLLNGSTPTSVSSGKTNTLNGNTNYPVITKSGEGVIYIAIEDTGTAGDTSWVVKCSTSCQTAGNWSDAGTNPLDTTNSFVMLLPMLTSTDIMLIRWLSPSTTSDLQSNIYDNSSSTWSGWTTIDANALSHNATPDYDAALYSATVDTSSGDIYLAYANDTNDYTTADHDIKSAKYVESSGTWSSQAAAVTNSDDGTATNLGIIAVNISLEVGTDNVYLLYGARTTIGTITTGDVYWKVSTDGMASWSTRTGPINTGGAGDMQAVRLNLMNNERVYATWVDATPDSLYGDTIQDLTPAPAGPNLSDLMRHGRYFNTSGVIQPFTF